MRNKTSPGRGGVSPCKGSTIIFLIKFTQFRKCMGVLKGTASVWTEARKRNNVTRGRGRREPAHIEKELIL